MSKKKKRQSFTVRDCLTIMGFLVIFFFFTIGNINETQQSTSENSHYQTVTIRQLWTSRSYCSSHGKMESTDGVVYNLPDDVYAVLCEKDAIGQTIHIYVYDKFPLPWGRLDPCVITAEIDGAEVGSVDAYNLDSALVRIITFSMGGFALLFAVLLIYICLLLCSFQFAQVIVHYPFFASVAPAAQDTGAGSPDEPEAL